MTNPTLAAISAVSRDLSELGIGKDNRNKEQGFNFRGIDQVLFALSPLLVKHGLVILPRVVERNVTEFTTKRGSVMRAVSINVDYGILHVDANPTTEGVMVRFPGEAMDSGDKATNKALSAAYKYMAIQTFCIPVNAASVPDADAENPVSDYEHPIRGSTRRQAEQTARESAISAEPAISADVEALDAEYIREESKASDATEPAQKAAETLSPAQTEVIQQLLVDSGYPAEPILTYYSVAEIKDLLVADYKSIKVTLEKKLRAAKGKPAKFAGVRE